MMQFHLLLYFTITLTSEGKTESYSLSARPVVPNLRSGSDTESEESQDDSMIKTEKLFLLGKGKTASDLESQGDISSF